MTKRQRGGSGTHTLTRQQRGYDKDWLKLSAAYKRANPLCEDCKDEGRVFAGTPDNPLHVDHVDPFRGLDDPKRLLWSNLRTRCASHHSRKTARDHGKRGYSNEVGADGWPADPNHPVNR